MANFDKAFLKRDTVRYVSRFDPSIDWDKSTCTKAEYAKDPGKHASGLRFFPDETPIYFVLEPPTSDQVLIAYAKAGLEYADSDSDDDEDDIDEAIEQDGDGDGKEKVRLEDIGLRAPLFESHMSLRMALNLGLIRANKEICSLCIKAIENYDHFPIDGRDAHFFDPLNMRRLQPSILDSLPDQIIGDVGGFIRTYSTMTDTKKKPSGSHGGGVTPLTNTATPTAATPAESPSGIETPGDAEAQANPMPLVPNNSTSSGLLTES